MDSRSQDKWRQARAGINAPSARPSCRLILAAVLAVTRVGKLLDLSGSRKALADFGLPAFVAAPLGTLLPLMELAVAVALQTA